ncbi:hypothetical protein TraAM80_03297 [Trypanosoma rangeli]|uniref:Polycystin cation channel PKD1/PKD2 domain-containing protein n=1 Tax=Trypanosoma rangeli TaxID=5698 RepID=A0A3R7L4N8_TRYRA|nr:uncharacterized protein TraAM80_03297 [Trypanosoma rangeli]RNF07553.1 hypothetical protein TraAM80_03297 [Trypanosoma rangeli]|eukprot:RNF07553.1 hypothetical protein TraAM80_03297 [Trypanosoma rangeli]
MIMQGEGGQNKEYAQRIIGTAEVAREMREGGDADLNATNVVLSETPHDAPRGKWQRMDRGLKLTPVAPVSPQVSPQMGQCREEHRRLVNEDFVTDPIRKLILYGNFPHKLVVNCLMLLFIVLLAVLCHTPEAIANEEQRKAVLHSFAGENYLGKDNGNVKFRPTVYLQKREDVLNEIEGFVKVYYALSNASVSELNYYYYTKSEGKAAHMGQLIGSEMTGVPACLHAMVDGAASGPDDAAGAVRLACVVPVSMEVDAYLYSQREYGGPATLRHFTAELTEENPLGPFSADKDENAEGDMKQEKYSEYEGRGVNPSATKSPGEGDPHTAGTKKDGHVQAMCAPRYDDITGLYYSPCRRALDANAKKPTHGTGDSNARFIFPLLDNVRQIRLKASMRHLTGTSLTPQETVSGFAVVIYHWTIEKIFSFHAGGLVEVEFVVSVVTKRFHPGLYSRFFFTAMLLFLAVFDIILRLHALRRIKLHRRSLAVSQDVSQEGEDLDSVCHQKGMDAVTHAGGNVAAPDASPQTECNATATRTTPNASPQFPQPQKAKLRQVKYVPKAGSLVPETVYTDFYDAWREQLQSSRGESWHYTALAADFFTLAYCITSSARLWCRATSEWHNTLESIVLGLTGLLLSVSFLSYIRYFPHMYFAVQAMRRVIPKLLLFAASVAPIFVGFSLFFCIVFGPHSNGKLSDMGFSLVVLYFVMFGDAILPTIEDAEQSVYPIVTVLANFMTMMFILFFMMTVLNLAMSITQHEWGMLRRRFGACLSANNLLFEVRTRDEVKAETLEVVIANMELLLHIKSEEQQTAGAAHERHAGNVSSASGDGSDAVGCVATTSRAMQEGVADLYRRRLDELTEGALTGAA